MDSTRLHVIDILNEFFAEQFADGSGIALRRMRAVRQQLTRCIDAEAYRVLDEEEYELLAIEKQFRPDNAFERIMHAEQLLWMLAFFLREEWALADPLARKQQLRLVDELTTRIAFSGQVCVECCRHSIEHIHEELARGKRVVREAEKALRARTRRR